MQEGLGILPPYPDNIVLAPRKSTVHRFRPVEKPLPREPVTPNGDGTAALWHTAPIDIWHRCVRRNIQITRRRMAWGAGAAARWHTTLVLGFGAS
jgi:hypothetical protein